MEKEFSLIGRLLYDTRRELGFTQEEVCHGLCSKSFFSRIEKGESEPDYLLVEALFTRMGVDAPKGLVPLTKEKYRRLKICEELNSIIDYVDPHGLYLLEEYKKGNPLKNLEQQVFALYNGWYISHKESKRQDAIKIYEDALKLTLPDFDVETYEMPKGLLSHYERGLINNIAHAEFHIYLYDKTNVFKRETALKRILFLKNYYEARVKDFDKKIMYSIILFNMTNWVGLDGHVKQALDYAKKGFSLKVNSKFYYESHLFNIGYSYASLGKKSDSEKLIKKSLALIDLTDKSNEVERLTESLKNKFQLDFS